MPLGGIGTGQVSICGDGGLRQWQIFNQVNHLGFVPDTFFALRASCTEPPLNVMRVLQSREVAALPERRAPLVNDDFIPREQRILVDRAPGVERTIFRGRYPFANISYFDSQLPVDVDLEAFNPLVPLDPESSGLPAILFTFRLENRSSQEIHGCLGASLQNAVGWDGLTPVAGNRCPLYGGNVNQARRRRTYCAITMENATLPEDHPGFGQMVLAALTPKAVLHPRWTAPEQFLRLVDGFNADRHGDEPGGDRTERDSRPDVTSQYERTHRNVSVAATGPSPAGETWNGGLLVPYSLPGGGRTEVTFVIAWHFPNRYVNFDSFGPLRDYGRSRFWLGNEYGARFGDALEVVDHVIDNRMKLEDKSRAWADAIFDSSFPLWLAEAIAVQPSLIRSPTCFRTEDGRFYGFEGSLGDSTGNWNAMFGGSCPLNCSHVWNYEQALARLFPSLERTMRETELEHLQAPEGYIPHRAIVPLYLPQLWGEPIGGPRNPALDGMLGAVLKVYREVRQGAGTEWLNRLWPRLETLLEYVRSRWDPDADGVLSGEQPNTYDIAFHGPNIYIGGLWLAALRAFEELAKLRGDAALAADLRTLFERASNAYDELLWGGEFYVQHIDPSESAMHQIGTGIFADQLLGQWWAHQLELGYVLPPEHVKTALRSIVRHNLREGFQGFQHRFRVFADGDDSGLLNCTWPFGGRPDIPVRYADEVWTGVEYQVGAHCIIEGLVEEGFRVLEALRARYSGHRRNPYNEIECGDHYSRAMAGWSALEAISGFRYNAIENALRLAPLSREGNFRSVYVAGSGWGTVEWNSHGGRRSLALSCLSGEIHVDMLVLGRVELREVMADLDGKACPVDVTTDEHETVLRFERPVTLGEGSRLIVEGECLNNPSAER
jgi:non-lysosomal glucosylceramidase